MMIYCPSWTKEIFIQKENNPAEFFIDYDIILFAFGGRRGILRAVPKQAGSKVAIWKAATVAYTRNNESMD